jgi:hypothetical protein
MTDPNNAITFAAILLAYAAAAMMWIKEPPVVRTSTSCSRRRWAGATDRCHRAGATELSRSR